MTSTDTIQLNYDIDSINSFLEIAFKDLVDLLKEEPSALTDLYYNREDECTMLSTTIEESLKSSRNIVILGGAGVGKSAFTYKIINSDLFEDKKKLFPIILDCKDIAPKSTNGILLSFIDQLNDFFSTIVHPANNILPNTVANIEDNLHITFSHIKTIPCGHHAVVFIDDLDYADDWWCELLGHILNYASLPRTTFVLAVRPPLLHAIDYYDDRFRSIYIRKGNMIELKPLNVEKVISMKIAPLLDKNDKNKFHSFLGNLLDRDSNVFWKIAKNIGINNIDDLPRISYPFTAKHNLFMRKITNGNLREIFDIAISSLIFIFENKEKLEGREEGDIIRKIIGRQNVLSLFLDPAKIGFKMINLHEKRSKNNDSLYYLVLQYIKLHSTVDEKFFQTISRFGFKKRNIEEALKFLSNRINRCIYKEKILPPNENSASSLEYKISEKGSYYLQIAEDWDEYITICGAAGRSLMK